jgi:hypothetical protein
MVKKDKPQPPNSHLEERNPTSERGITESPKSGERVRRNDTPTDKEKSQQRFQREQEIISQRNQETPVQRNIELTREHFNLIRESSQERKTVPHHIDAVRATFTGKMELAINALSIPEIDNIEVELSPHPTFQEMEILHYEKVKRVHETFDQRFVTIRTHLVDHILDEHPDLRDILRTLIHVDDQTFFQKVESAIFTFYGPNKANQILGEKGFLRMAINLHQSQYEKQRDLRDFKLKRLDKEFAQQVGQASEETVNDIHRDFIHGLQDAIDEFRNHDNPIHGPIIILLEKFKEQTIAAPGEEILKAVRKMLILTTFDKEKAGPAFFNKLTLTRALVLGFIKNYWENSGENILTFQENLKKWWVTHVNRPIVNEEGEVIQEIKSPMLNSERGSYFTMFSLEDEKLEALQTTDQPAAVAILVREQLLSTIVDQERNEELDILDGWTHVDMPRQDQYSVVIHKGSKFKKIIIDHSMLPDINKFIEFFTAEFSNGQGWTDFEPNNRTIKRAMSGKVTIQDATERKLDSTDYTSADTSLVLLADNEEANREDVIQRGMQSWTHGAGIKFSLTLFVDQEGKLTGRGAQKGAHAWTDGRVSTLKLQDTLERATTLFNIHEDNDLTKRAIINSQELSDGTEFIYHEQEAELHFVEISRNQYQERIQKLFEFFKKTHTETPFTLDINGLISTAIMMSLNDAWQISGRNGQINNIQFLERAQFVRSGVRIGDSVTPVPLQFNTEMQDETREFVEILEKDEYQGRSLEEIAQAEGIPIHEAKKKLQQVVLSFAFFDEERKLVRKGEPGIIAVMAEMAGKIRKPLTTASGITSRELTDMAIRTVLISSLIPARPRTTEKDDDINIESFSTAIDEVYEYFGFVIATSSYGTGENERISVVLRQMEEVLQPVLNTMTTASGETITLQTMIEKNMERVLLMLESYQQQYEAEIKS